MAHSPHHYPRVTGDLGRLAWPALGLVAAVLLGMIALEAAGTVVDEQTAVASPAQQPLKALDEAAMTKAADSSQWTTGLLARPMFTKTRQPSTPATPAAEAPKSLPRLTGVVMSPLGKFVIFAGIDGSKPVVAGEGDHVGAAVIEAIKAGQVTMRGPNGSIVLHPAFDDSVVPASRSNPASPAKAAFRQLPLPFRRTPQALRGGKDSTRRMMDAQG